MYRGQYPQYSSCISDWLIILVYPDPCVDSLYHMHHSSISIYGEFGGGYSHIIIEMHDLDTAVAWPFVVIKYEVSMETYEKGMNDLWYI